MGVWLGVEVEDGAPAGMISDFADRGVAVQAAARPEVGALTDGGPVFERNIEVKGWLRRLAAGGGRKLQAIFG